MILNLLKEDINDIKEDKLRKEYERNYSDVPVDDFIKMVKMDPSSYPRNGAEANLNAEPNRVGNLASGGNGGLLIRCYRKGERDFLNKPEEVLAACDYFLKNRANLEIKNPGMYNSVEDFIKATKGETVAVNTDAQIKKVKETSEEKLEKFRAKAFPDVKAEDFLEIIKLDPETNLQAGELGNIARNFLLPAYQKGDTQVLKKKISLKRALIDYYATGDNNIKFEDLLASETPIKDFLANFHLVNSKIDETPESNLIQLLKAFAPEDGYTIVASNENYDVVEYYEIKEWQGYYSKYVVGYITSYPNVSVDSVKDWNQKNPSSRYENPFVNARNRSTFLDSTIHNSWCTGWTDSYMYSNHYTAPKSDERGARLVAFICKHASEGYRRNYQISNEREMDDSVLHYLENHGKLAQFSQETASRGQKKSWLEDAFHENIHDLEGGENNHGSPFERYLEPFMEMLRNNSSLIPYIRKLNAFKGDWFEAACKFFYGPSYTLPTEEEIMALEREKSWNEDEVEEEKIFVYNSPEDLEQLRKHKYAISYLEIAEGVTEIPAFAFEKFLDLISVKFPSTLKKIGPRAFFGCRSLYSIELPEGLEEIGSGAFEGCTSLGGSIRLPNSLTKIGLRAFSRHNKRGLSFTVSPKKTSKLEIHQMDHDFYFKQGRIKFGEN